MHNFANVVGQLGQSWVLNVSGCPLFQNKDGCGCRLALCRFNLQHSLWLSIGLLVGLIKSLNFTIKFCRLMLTVKYNVISYVLEDICIIGLLAKESISVQLFRK